MSKNILIINGTKEFGHSKGLLNQHLVDVSENYFKEKGYTVKISLADANYIINEEVTNFLWADVILYQFPVWWMGMPWSLKRYIDEVFTSGQSKLYTNDGRSEKDKSKKYGSGGLLQGKKYMISATWNAPLEALQDTDDFFEGAGNDRVFLPLHKANQFLGLSPLQTFTCHDVIKSPNISVNVTRFIEHLKNV